MDDSFIASYIGDLLRALRTQYLITLIKPYSRLDMSFLSKQLNVGKPEVEEILIGLILEGKVEGTDRPSRSEARVGQTVRILSTSTIDSLGTGN
jgi:hypothetical protein